MILAHFENLLAQSEPDSQIRRPAITVFKISGELEVEKVVYKIMEGLRNMA